MLSAISAPLALPICSIPGNWTVDRLLDMMRTSVNVWSDSCITLIIADKEGDIDETVLFESEPVEAMS